MEREKTLLWVKNSLGNLQGFKKSVVSYIAVLLKVATILRDCFLFREVLQNMHG